MSKEPVISLVALSASVTVAYLTGNALSAEELPALIRSVYSSLKRLETPEKTPTAASNLVPAVPIKKSVTPDCLFCLEDGKQYRSLKRHLRTHHGMSPDDYRLRWDLAADYPMAAPAYSQLRSALAKSTGLGRNRQKMA